MLNERFLSRLSDAFPEFYARVDEEARAEAARLRLATGGDVGKALTRARLEGAAKLWWPYVKGSLPLAKRERDAMEGFARLVLTVGHLVGHQPERMEVAREHVVGVLRQSLDHERLLELAQRTTRGDGKDEAKAAAAGAGIMATLTTLTAPISMFRNARRYVRFVPPPARVAVAAVVVAALASVPLVAGLSAGHKAERAARGATMPIEAADAGEDITRAA